MFLISCTTVDDPTNSIVSHNYKSTDYSISQENFDSDNKAFLEFTHSNNLISLNFDLHSEHPFTMAINGKVSTNISVGDSTVNVNNYDVSLTESEISSIKLFDEKMSFTNISWPGNPHQDTLSKTISWWPYGIEFGNRLSAQQACSENTGGGSGFFGCHKVSDCACLWDDFGCLCVCAVICFH